MFSNLDKLGKKDITNEVKETKSCTSCTYCKTVFAIRKICLIHGNTINNSITTALNCDIYTKH